jgi:predicted aconitase
VTWAVLHGAYDAQIFTNDREKLGAALGHEVSHSSAHVQEMKPEQKQEQAITPQREIAPKQEQEQSLDIGLGL